MNMQAMLKQAQALQKDMLKIKDEIDSTEFVGESSLVKVTVKGTKEVVKVEIDSSESLDKDEIEMLQDMIVIAVNEANILKNIAKNVTILTNGEQMNADSNFKINTMKIKHISIVSIGKYFVKWRFNI